MLSISQDKAVQMLESGWTVKYSRLHDAIQWRSPSGISGSEFLSASLDHPPTEAVEHAKINHHIVDRPRAPKPKDGSQ